jgi:Lrp/AsnC family leucine-responsive transcriptional regulator
MDEVDRQIVNQLVLHGRASLTDIARVVSLSVPAVKRRIGRLERDNVIRGYTAIVDEPDVRKMYALVELFCTKDARREEAIEVFESRPEVLLGFTVAGDSDVILLVRTESTDHLEALLLDLRGHPIVERTRAQIMLHSLIGRIPI